MKQRLTLNERFESEDEVTLLPDRVIIIKQWDNTMGVPRYEATDSHQPGKVLHGKFLMEIIHQIET